MSPVNDTKIGLNGLFQEVELPPGSQRTSNYKYELVHIPASKTHGNKIKPVSISAMGEVGEVIFNGITQLNQIQSAVFNTAFHSSVNMLICAPTGAGKTNIALTCMLREINNNIINVLNAP